MDKHKAEILCEIGSDGKDKVTVGSINPEVVVMILLLLKKTGHTLVPLPIQLELTLP